MQYKLLGEEHPDTLLSLNNLAVTYGELGDHSKALELKKKVYDLQCRVLGEEHPDTLATLSNMAIAYIGLGHIREALRIWKKVRPSP